MANTFDTRDEPLGSTSPKVLYNNASNLDDAVNGDAPSWTDRFGKDRYSWAGMETTFDQFLVNSGFEPNHLTYTDGQPLTVLRPTQLIDRAGSVYRVKMPATFPVSLTGTWAADEALLVDAGDSSLRQSLSENSGAAMVGFDPGYTYSDETVGRELQYLSSGTVVPEMFGAKGDGAADDWAALTAAVAAIRANGGGVLNLGSGGKSYALSKPLKLYSNMRITGRGYLIARAGFSTGVTFPTYNTGVLQTYNTLLYFNDGTQADDPGNFGYRGLEIDAGVEIYGNYNCENGLILEGITNYRISGRFQRFNSVGVYAKYYCWGGTINAHISSCRTALLKLGEAANGIDLNGLKAYGDADNPTYGIQIVGDNNGINLSGAFVEKMINGIHWSGFSGPSNITGVDFEDCFGDLITVDGTGLTGRAAGPVTISGSFMEATNRAVKAINAIVIVSGCRIRDTALAFDTSGPTACIYEECNQLEGATTRALNGNVISGIPGSISRRQVNRLPNGLGSPVTGYSLENNFYTYNPDLSVGGLSWGSAVFDVPTQRMLTTSTWQTSELRNGSTFGVLGLRLNYLDGLKSIEPLGDNDHSIGKASLRIASITLGTAPIVTSDENDKEDIEVIDAAVLRAWEKVNFYQYRLKDAVTAKGESARVHFGIIAQRVKDAFESEGLDPFKYGVLCRDEWPAVEAKAAEYTEEGELVSPEVGSREGGVRFGVRYEEALALTCACLMNKL